MTKQEAFDKMKSYKPDPPVPNDQVIEIFSALHGHQPNSEDWRHSYSGLWFQCVMTADRLRREGYGRA